MIYHYTDKISFARIRSDGVLRAKPMTLHRDLLAQDAGYVTPPIIWLTIRPEPDPTVIASMLCAGWPREMYDNLFRVVLPDDLPCMLLGKWADASGIDPAWLKMLVQTATIGGANWRDWRIASSDIRSPQWTRREKLTVTGWQTIGE